MKVYNIERGVINSSDFDRLITERHMIKKYLEYRNSTIPQIAKALSLDEENVACHLAELTTVRLSETCINDDKWEIYNTKANKLRWKHPVKFTDTTMFYGRGLR